LIKENKNGNGFVRIRADSSRFVVLFPDFWVVGFALGELGIPTAAILGKKKKTPAFWARCLPEGRKCAVGA
jgi:hypothetical protein